MTNSEERKYDDVTYARLVWRAREDLSSLPIDIQSDLAAKWDKEQYPFEDIYLDIQNAKTLDRLSDKAF